MLALFLVGALAYRLLPVSALPQVDYPTVQVVTLYPGASAEVMASSVTAPLERQFGQMPGLSRMSSNSSGGASTITLQFSLERSIDVAIQDVQAAINAASNLLPTDLPMPPIYNKVNPADTPVLTLAVMSDSLPLSKVQDIVETRLAQKISQVQGVGLVTLAGGNRPAIRIQVNPTAVASLGLSLEDVRTAVGSASVNQPKGSFDGAQQASTLDSNDQLKTAAEYENMVVAYKQGATVRLSDIAKIQDGVENTRLAAWANRKSAIIMNIQRQPGANVIQTVDRIHALLPSLQEGLPSAIKIQALTDRTDTIRESIHDVQFEMMLSIALVVMVMFIFLRNLSATLIPSITIPLSIVGTFGGMYLMGFSLNNLTLMALTVATGFVVDDAIVMIENISRYLEQGDSPKEAALKGSKQIAFTVISLTFSLIAVLIPLLFMGDNVGKLFREFTLTLAVAILLSAVISLTLTPMMCAQLLRQGSIKHESEDATDYESDKSIIGRVIGAYAVALKKVLEYKKITLLVALATLLLTIWMYIVIPKGFFPVQDTGIIQGISEAPTDISFEAMAKRQQALIDIILKDPAVENISAFIGADGSNPTLNAGRLLINLKKHGERDPVKTVIHRLNQAIEHKVVGINLFMQPVQDLTMDESLSRTQYQWIVDSPNADTLKEWLPKLVDGLRQLPTITGVSSDGQAQLRQLYVNIHRDAAARLGITPAAVSNALYNAFGQRLISTLFTQSNQYRVVLEVDPHFQRGAEALDQIFIPSTLASTGSSVTNSFTSSTNTTSTSATSVASTATVRPSMVRLSSIATIEERSAPLVINRLGQFPAATISFNLAPGAALSEAVDGIEQVRQHLMLPDSIQTRFQGAALAFRASLQNTPFLMLAAVVTMYIVLGVLYESFIHPITILSTLPSAGLGALIALVLTGNDLSVMGIIGIVLLIGIVKKNAIMMIDFALEAERERGLLPERAIYEACLVRFRPILMTTLAALLGALPMMLGSGAGSELRQPLGITMVGGLLVSQVLTLFTTPVIYLAFHRLQERFGSKEHAVQKNLPSSVTG